MFSTGGWHDYIDFVLGCTSLQKSLKMFKVNLPQVMLPCPRIPRAIPAKVLVATKVASWCDVVVTPCLGHSAWDNFIPTKICDGRSDEMIGTDSDSFWLFPLKSACTRGSRIRNRCSTPAEVLSPGGAMFSMPSGAWWHLPACWWCCRRWAAHMNHRVRFQLRMEDWKCKILRCSHHAVDCQGCWGNPWNSLFAWWQFYQ